MTFGSLFIGCAGWNIHPAHKDAFPVEGTHLQRYAARLHCVEINSSFYKPHRAATYARWASAVPAQFRFAVKFPKEVTHVRLLQDVAGPTERFFESVNSLAGKAGPILVQTPPRLEFQRSVAVAFFATLRSFWTASIVFEPRHPSWFDPDVDSLLKDYRIGRVAADPSCVHAARDPGGWPDLIYYRLHGSPRIYYSSYGADALRQLARNLDQQLGRGREVWCIFDNTALGAAAINAFQLADLCTDQAPDAHSAPR